MTNNETVAATKLWGRNRPAAVWDEEGNCGSCRPCVEAGAAKDVMRRMGNGVVLGRAPCLYPLSAQKVLV